MQATPGHSEQLQQSQSTSLPALGSGSPGPGLPSPENTQLEVEWKAIVGEDQKTKEDLELIFDIWSYTTHTWKCPGASEWPSVTPGGRGFGKAWGEMDCSWCLNLIQQGQGVPALPLPLRDNSSPSPLTSPKALQDPSMLWSLGTPGQQRTSTSFLLHEGVLKPKLQKQVQRQIPSLRLNVTWFSNITKC